MAKKRKAKKSKPKRTTKKSKPQKSKAKTPKKPPASNVDAPTPAASDGLLRAWLQRLPGSRGSADE